MKKIFNQKATLSFMIMMILMALILGVMLLINNKLVENPNAYTTSGKLYIYVPVYRTTNTTQPSGFKHCFSVSSIKVSCGVYGADPQSMGTTSVSGTPSSISGLSDNKFFDKYVQYYSKKEASISYDDWRWPTVDRFISITMTGITQYGRTGTVYVVNSTSASDCNNISNVYKIIKDGTWTANTLSADSYNGSTTGSYETRWSISIKSDSEKTNKTHIAIVFNLSETDVYADPPDGSHITYLTEYTKEKFKKEGYILDGFYSKPSGGGIKLFDVSDNEEKCENVFTNFHEGRTNVKVYPYYIPNTYTIKYEGNGATRGSTASSSHTYDSSKTLSKNGFEKEGYHFVGWSTSRNGSKAYSDGQSVKNLTSTNGGIVTLYAKWEPNTLNYTYDYNGGSGSNSGGSAQYGDTITLQIWH